MEGCKFCEKLKKMARGDEGQRYEVSFLNENEKRVIVGWSDKPETALSMLKVVTLHPVWHDGKAVDRKPEAKCRHEFEVLKAIETCKGGNVTIDSCKGRCVLCNKEVEMVK